jgi:hypothetical protein
MEMRPLLEQLEASGDPTAGVAYLAAAALALDPDELRAARRRALLLLATGGDPRRELDPDGRAVASVAEDLDVPGRRVALAAALEALRRESGGLPSVTGALDRLSADGQLAWRFVAYVLLAEELAGAEE